MTVEICRDFYRTCTACGACTAACPKYCIHFKRNAEGFDFPTIDAENCVSCGRCVAVCPNNVDFDVPAAHCAWAFQEADGEARKSSSGGAFHALALNVLAQDGAVYGFAFEGNRLVMSRATDAKELEALRGSKYVQGIMSNSHRSIASDISAGVQTLVCGTPCQIAGVGTLFGPEARKHALLVDVICHGVPAPGIFEQHAAWLSKKNRSLLAEISFRDKRHAHWLISKHYRYRFADGSEIHGNWKADPFYNAYLKGSIMRECCYRCRYATLNRISDLTVGDFWGLTKAPEGMSLSEGVSAIVAHTERGVRAVENLRPRGVLSAVNVADVVMGNPNLVRPTMRPKNRDVSYRDIADVGYDKWARRQVTVKDRLSAYVSNVVPVFAVELLFGARRRLKGKKK